jgi:hypothetical protein
MSSHPWLNPHLWVIAITPLFTDPVCTDLYTLVNAFIRRPAHGGPVHCEYIQGVYE